MSTKYPGLKEWLDAWNNDDLPDGAWWAVLEEGAEAYIKDRKLKKTDAFDLVHVYISLIATKVTK